MFAPTRRGTEEGWPLVLIPCSAPTLMAVSSAAHDFFSSRKTASGIENPISRPQALTTRWRLLSDGYARPLCC